MSKTKSMGLIVFLLSFVLVSGAKTIEIPQTNAGNILSKFLKVLETGEIEEFLNKHAPKDKFPPEKLKRQIGFLQMIHQHHGGFNVYKMIESKENKIEVICQGKKSKAWRLILIAIDKNTPDKIAGMDIRQTNAPEEFLSTMPEIKIQRPKNDDSIVKGILAKKIDNYMTGIESKGYSGALGIIKDGQVILSKGYGYADREKKRMFDRKTVFTIGSITKQFTGGAMVKLESMGKISFMDPITRFFKNVPEDKKDITIHMLLTHTAGFPGAIGSDYDKIPRDDFIKQALAVKLKLEPGDRYSYSNVGFSLAGAIIEIVTDGSFEEFLRKNLFLPAGLSRTGYTLPKWDKDDIVTGYQGEKRWGTPIERLWGKDGPGWHLMCNGGIMTTIDEICKWGQSILGNEVFTEDEKKKYLTPYVPEGPEADSYYAYGWVRMKSSRGTEVITHNGGNPYIQNDMYIYPEDKVIVYITSNNGQFSAINQSSKILKMIFNIK